MFLGSFENFKFFRFLGIFRPTTLGSLSWVEQGTPIYPLYQISGFKGQNKKISENKPKVLKVHHIIQFRLIFRF